MERQILFPQIKGILHGGDYNPEQWLDRPDILEEDIRMMKKAGMNSATLGVFSWSAYEPREGEYHFEWLTECVDRLYENGIYTILATPSGAKPVWLDEKYPEALRVDAYGVRSHHGVRHNHCMSSALYREKVRNIVTRLHKAVGDHPGVILWHISNEFGGECYCPLCVKRFQEYLSHRFDGDIDRLNHAWWTPFWSHRYERFDQIEPPYQNGEYSIMGLKLEWRRFTTWNMTDYMRSEIDLLRELTPDRPVTTNFMQLYEGLDYRKMAEYLDVISWDSYPCLHNDYESLWDTMTRNAFDHAVMRGMKRDKPFMLMESAPGLVNWHRYNKLKRPGIHRLFSIHALACGSDTVQYFQWRKSRGSYEQYHGAVVDHLGRDDTRIFREVEALGAELKRLEPVAGSTVRARVALILDWDVMWAIRDMRGLADETKRYEETCAEIYRTLLGLGVDVDVINQTDTFEGYRVIVAPMLYLLKEGVAERMKAFVENGGELMATYLTGYVDDNALCFLGGFPGDGLNELFGVVSEEIDTLYPSDRNGVRFADESLREGCAEDGSGKRAEGESGDRAQEGIGDCAEGEVRDYAERLRVTRAGVLGTYTSDFYAGEPAVTERAQGRGHALYVGCRLSVGSMRNLFARMLDRAEVERRALPEGVEYHVRCGDGHRYEFLFNMTDRPAEILDVRGIDLLTGEQTDGTFRLEPCGVAVIDSREQ
ncbi:MAG: beta-galactosidase [Clostridium sp.]|nr:beta-galactosidase [Acetatifactor muris]MCM1526724.1 beta-galactosidase [Bacteroides sp.]MCM1562816.1 beta-galactosidase [Clostridium sp.]